VSFILECLFQFVFDLAFDLLASAAIKLLVK
jgi:hypothetical protein